MGMARQIRIREDETTFSTRSDAHIIAAPGIFGGLSSNLTRITRNPGTPQAEILHSKTAGLTLAAGERVRVETLGGGGYGSPSERDNAEIARDLREGKITRAAAERDYGVAKVAAALDNPPDFN
jgi:N-methylhydantoinase B